MPWTSQAATATAIVVTIHRKTKCRTRAPYAQTRVWRNRFAKIRLQTTPAPVIESAQSR
jgi:hypothetical protein